MGDLGYIVVWYQGRLVYIDNIFINLNLFRIKKRYLIMFYLLLEEFIFLHGDIRRRAKCHSSIKQMQHFHAFPSYSSVSFLFFISVFSGPYQEKPKRMHQFPHHIIIVFLFFTI